MARTLVFRTNNVGSIPTGLTHSEQITLTKE